MIIVDGRTLDLDISGFANLEEALKAIMEDASLQGRIVTDVLVNDENFSEIYPHQAEDKSLADVEKIEIKSEPAGEMAVKMSAELEKAAILMTNGARNVARLLREGRDTDALELFQDLLDVTRDFMGLLTHLRDRYLGGADIEFVERTEAFSNLLSEMSEVLENEDWILLADMLEFEFVPACDKWREIGQELHEKLVVAAEVK